jgi:hypothetical protein
MMVEVGHEKEDFSLVLGGPLYQLMLRSGLIEPPLGHLAWRIGVITGIAWLPLVLLTIVAGRFAGGVRVPLLYDCEVHTRLLFSLPLMIMAELVVYGRMRVIGAEFQERQIITGRARLRFEDVLSSAMRLRNSALNEFALLLIVIIAGRYVWQESIALHSDTWYATVARYGQSNTAAGRWYTFVSLPIFQFVLLRWYYRIFIWFRFLFQVSRLDLNLIPLHPDRRCGIGFLGTVATAFSPLLMAHSGVVAGFIANRILHEGATLPNYKYEILGLAVFLLTLFFGPLCVFIPNLHGARLAGLRTYGRLASGYVLDFADKWAQGSVAPNGEHILGSADIQSLADLGNSFSIVTEIRLVPFGKGALVQFLVAIILPLAPLVFTMFSLEELLKRLLRAVL